ncbi:glycogen/starch/alpha-glucan phosphorylase [Shigella flexneri]
MGLNLEELIDEENDPASVTVAWDVWRLASSISGDVRVAGRGYGIRDDYGMFKQNIVNGSQKKSPDDWLDMATRGNSTRQHAL